MTRCVLPFMLFMWKGLPCSLLGVDAHSLAMTTESRVKVCSLRKSFYDVSKVCLSCTEGSNPLQ